MTFLSDQTPSCPPALLAKAKLQSPPRVAIANAGAPLPMQAAHDATNAGIMTPIFIGNTEKIAHEAAALNWDISGFQVTPADGETAAASTAAGLCGAGGADVLMKGDLHTDVFLKGALSRDAGLRTGARLVHVFHISPPDGSRPILISDAAVNVAPDIQTRRNATRAVVDLLHQLGTEQPRVAFLSATEVPIASVPNSLEARALSVWAKSEIPNAHFSGPLALDLILSPDAARIKGLTDDPVAGHADAIIVPDITTGNALFKALVYLAGGCAAGLVIGAKVPILLTSRADPAAARLASAALAAIQFSAAR
ncbi:MAG: phosphate acyltransferase [Paracoccaceae bacterium]